jgi:hypothetical protein
VINSAKRRLLTLQGFKDVHVDVAEAKRGTSEKPEPSELAV